jgi:predicted phage terminase large subunit-like protein
LPTNDRQRAASPQPSLSDRLARTVGVRSALAPYLASDFAAFARSAWKVVNPREPLMWSPAYDLLCQALMLMTERDPKWRRVIWNHPPRLAKSFFCSIAYPCWVWLRDPSHRFVCASYSMDLSNKHNAARRLLITSAWFQQLFADRFKLVEERADELVNDKGGCLFSSSVGARFTGFGFDTCIADDLTSTDMALSDAERTKANVWFDSTLRSRANNPASATIFLVSQRVHEQDVPGYLLASEPGIWTHVSIPLVAEEPTTYEIGKAGWDRPKGDVLLPKRFPPQVVKELQSRRLTYSGQYQQIPVPLEGNLVRASDIAYYGPLDEPLPDSFDLVLVSVDCSFKSGEEHDFTAIVVVGCKGSRRFVVDAVNAHLLVGGMIAAIHRQHEKWHPSAVLVEGKAAGEAVIQALRAAGISGVIEVVPKGGKLARLHAVSPEFQSHDWVFPRNASWAGEIITQLLQAPRARHDDLSDAISQAGVWLQEHHNSFTQPPPIIGGSYEGLGALYRRLVYGEPQRELSQETSLAVLQGKGLQTDGSGLTDAQVDEIVFGCGLPPGALDEPEAPSNASERSQDVTLAEGKEEVEHEHASLRDYGIYDDAQLDRDVLAAIADYGDAGVARHLLSEQLANNPLRQQLWYSLVRLEKTAKIEFLGVRSNCQCVVRITKPIVPTT